MHNCTKPDHVTRADLERAIYSELLARVIFQQFAQVEIVGIRNIAVWRASTEGGAPVPVDVMADLILRVNGSPIPVPRESDAPSFWNAALEMTFSVDDDGKATIVQVCEP